MSPTELGRRLDAAVDDRDDVLDDLTADLVRARGELGDEERAQALVADLLGTMGFAVERVSPDLPEVLGHPESGYPPLPYAGRTCVVGRRGDEGPTLHLSGHVDVVPVERPERWRHDPWGAERSGGRLWGRGAGDMKAGLAAYLVGVQAALDVCGGDLPAQLIFSSVLEEECGGNGMRAVLNHVGDRHPLLIGEPTGLDLHYAGVGVIWFRVTVAGTGAHAAFAHPDAPVDDLLAAVSALRSLEADLNARRGDSVFCENLEHPFNLNLGVVGGGSWPSSVPEEVVLRGRLGFGRDLTPAQAQERVTRALGSLPRVQVAFDGFRAPAYAHRIDGHLGDAVRTAHAGHCGSAPEPRVDTFTTDARMAAGEALCYGPRAGAIHGRDEWVELDSVRQVARTIARLVGSWGRGASG